MDMHQQSLALKQPSERHVFIFVEFGFRSFKFSLYADCLNFKAAFEKNKFLIFQYLKKSFLKVV